MSTDSELAAAIREQRALREAADRRAEAIAERAYAEKDPALSDEEIAARCGRSREWVRSWRRRTGRKAHSPHIAARPELSRAARRAKDKRAELQAALRAKYPEAYE